MEFPSLEILILLSLFLLLSGSGTAGVRVAADSSSGTVLLQAYAGESPPTLNLAYWIQASRQPSDHYLVLVPGGPGQSYDQSGWTEFENINLVYFDPRGVGRSKTEDPKTMARPDFNTSEAIAIDMETLRRHLLIPRWDVYGFSYGSIPATIYASQHPDHMGKLLLEGSVGAGGKSLWQPSDLTEVYQRAWASLTASTRMQASGILTGSNWFSALMLDALPQNFGISELNERVDRYLAHPRKQPFSGVSFAQVLADSQGETPWMYLYVTCSELGGDEFSVDRHFAFDGQTVEPWPAESLTKACRNFVSGSRRFASENYPLRVPVIFFHGENDIIASRAAAHERFLSQTRTSPAMFFTLPNGGHAALSEELDEMNRLSPVQAATQHLVERLLLSFSSEHSNATWPELRDLKAEGLDWQVESSP